MDAACRLIPSFLLKETAGKQRARLTRRSSFTAASSSCFTAPRTRDGTSRLGYAESSDGIHFSRLPQPVLSPEAEYEKDGGVEDPRLVKFGDTYYLTYTGYNKKDAQLCLATSKDLLHWQRQGVILPAYKGHWNVGWTKSGAIVPEKINGRYWMYFLGTSADKTDQMGLASSTDLIHWTEATAEPVLPRRPVSSIPAWLNLAHHRS